MLTVNQRGDLLSIEVESQIEEFLNGMGVRYQKEEGVIASLWKVGDGEYWVFVLTGDDWVAIRTTILESGKVPDSVEFYRALLNAHYTLAEVRYDVDEEGNLGSSKTIPVSGMNKDIFASEFNSVVFAIDYFRQEIAPKFGIEL